MDPLTDLLTQATDPKTALATLAAARGLLFVLDLLDKRFPRLEPVARILGKLLGGAKAR